MTRLLVPDWCLGASRVAHRMVDCGSGRPGGLRYVSRCGRFYAERLLPAADGVRRCAACLRCLAADERLQGPYRPGDRARVLHASRHGTTVGVLVVASCAPSKRAGQWLVEFDLGDEVRSLWPAFVGPDGRDRNGYVEPVERAR